MTARRHFLCSLGMAGLSLAPGHAAGLRVVHDAGGGVPYEQWLAQSQQPGAAGEANPSAWRFPLNTPGLKPGTLKQDRQWQHAEWLTQPIAVVGSDARSRRWLTQHANALETMNARGLVVECPDAAAFQALQIAAGVLPLAPLAKRWLVEQLHALHVTVMPLLITPQGVVTQQPGVRGKRPTTVARGSATATRAGPRP